MSCYFIIRTYLSALLCKGGNFGFLHCATLNHPKPLEYIAHPSTNPYMSPPPPAPTAAMTDAASASRWAMCGPSLFPAVARVEGGEWVYGEPVSGDLSKLEVTVNGRPVQAPLCDNLIHIWAPWAAETERVHAVEKYRGPKVAAALRERLPWYLPPGLLNEHIGSGVVDAAAADLERHDFVEVAGSHVSKHGPLHVVMEGGAPRGVAVAVEGGYDFLQGCEPPRFGRV